MYWRFEKINNNITVDELATKLQQPLQLLDVRRSDEYYAGHIAAALSVPYEVIRYLPAFIQKTKPVYLICTGGVRSVKAAKKLQQQGYQVVNVLGGMRAWQGPTVATPAPLA